MPDNLPANARLRTAVVGTGALGRHHVRILSELSSSELVGVHDVEAERAEALATAHGTQSFSSLPELLEQAEAVVVAVPTVHHLVVARQALEAGCHVMVEKPIAASLEEARELISLASEKARVLAVGHVEFYNPAVQELLRRGVRPRFIEVQRLSVFTPRSLDVDVVLDLMIHDLQIVAALDSSAVCDLRAVGMHVLSSRIDIADVRLELASGCVVKLTASRISDVRVRNLRVFGQNSYYSIDYQAQSLKGFRLEDDGSGSSQGSLEVVRAAPEQSNAATTHGARRILPIHASIETVEPLRQELQCFLARCAGDEGAPLVTGEEGLEALRLGLEIVEQSQAAARQSV